MSGGEVLEERKEKKQKELDERAERIVDHSRELEELREKKQKRIQKEAVESKEKSNSFLSRFKLPKSPAISGWIRDARKDGFSGEYILTVDVCDDDEVIEKEFRLDWPEDESEMDIDNDVVRLAHLVGESDTLDDILEQEVPILKRGGSYHLDLPESTSRTRRLTNWSRRKLLDIGVLTQGEKSVDLNTNLYIGVLLVVSLIGIAISGSHIATLVGSFPSIILGLLSVAGIGLMGWVVIGAISLFSPFPVGIFMLQLFIGVVYSFSTIPTGIGGEDQSVMAFMGDLYAVTGTAFLFCISVLGLGAVAYYWVKPVLDRGVNGVKNLYKKWKLHKGIDYFRLED